ncbi:MAG: RNA polymerase subunit sigma [Clostridiales bacterium]|nr:RNA polymerase subunit sigma [Clostridiales bacterium]
MRQIDSQAMAAKNDKSILEKLVSEQESAMLRYASRITGRYISKSDDEWSITLLAFTQAIDSYDFDKGNFISFYRLLIKRRLIDYHRNQSKFNQELTVDPILFDTEPEEEDDDISIRLAVSNQVSKQESSDLKLEIETANQAFSNYGFSFFDLTNCSPHAKKTKSSCAKAVNYMMDNPLLIEELHTTKQLPIKIIEKNTKVPRKTLDRHRKYIIAAIELLSGEYPNLAEYLQYIRKENG